MALPTTPTYTTLDEFKAHTRVESQKTIADANWSPHALHAEQIIDAYIGKVNSYASDQDLKFPINEDGESVFPNDLKKAHIEITTDLILKGDQKEAGKGAVKGESWSSSRYSKDFETGGNLNQETIQSQIPPLAKRLLRQYGGGTAAATY